MAYTKVSELTLANGNPTDPQSEFDAIYSIAELTHGGGNFDSALTHFYGEDIKKVLLQGENGENGPAKVVFIHVKFERVDGENDDIHEITVIGAINDTGKVYPLLALPWQPYYREESPQYEPGNYLKK